MSAVDKRAAARTVPGVFRLGRLLLTCFVLTLWWGASQHCALEAAGWLATQTECCAEAADPCAQDACETVENAAYRAATSSQLLVAPLPADLAPDFLLTFLLPAPAAAPVVAPARPEHAKAWLKTWQFERRAVPPSHAPDAVVA